MGVASWCLSSFDEGVLGTEGLSEESAAAEWLKAGELETGRLGGTERLEELIKEELETVRANELELLAFFNLTEPDGVTAGWVGVELADWGIELEGLGFASWVGGAFTSWVGGAFTSWVGGAFTSWVRGTFTSWVGGAFTSWVGGAFTSWMGGAFTSWVGGAFRAASDLCLLFLGFASFARSLNRSVSISFGAFVGTVF